MTAPPDMAKTNMSTAFYSQDQVHAKAQEEPGARAMTWQYDDVTRPLSPRGVRTMVNDIRRRMARMRADDPSATDGELAARLRREDPDVELFAGNSHPKIFACVIQRELPPGVLDTLFHMIRVRARVVANPDTESREMAQLQEDLLNRCKKNA